MEEKITCYLQGPNLQPSNNAPNALPIGLHIGRSHERCGTHWSHLVLVPQKFMNDQADNGKDFERAFGFGVFLSTIYDISVV